jgi:tetratricopeptide (TPR) repeat protein
MVAKARGDESAARADFQQARDAVAKIVQEQPDYAEAVCALGVLDAALGNKESAISNGQRAVSLFAPSGNAIEGAVALHYLALIYAWTGEKDRAFETLTTAAKTPGSVSFGELKLHPFWDPLRGDRRFDTIVTSLAQK